MKRVFIILDWTAGAYFASGMAMSPIFGVFVGITAGICSIFHHHLPAYLPVDHPLFIFWFRGIFRAIMALIALAALALGLQGRLPGTGLKKVPN
jgi:hypothetical protein